MDWRYAERLQPDRITKHGILIVEFGNQLRDQGKDLISATIEAASLRLRPILMTTGAMVLGAVPLAFATGAGAESRIQIGMVIVGGMSFGTLLTLFVLPTVYTLLTRKRHIITDAQVGGAGHGDGGGAPDVPPPQSPPQQPPPQPPRRGEPVLH
ncbi:MAG: hypothetical protein ABT05_08070 [Lautropia sp. SCN 66-9]|nr:MAG: hypothetical protein ABT05_08070 [Lautropia sp. SCN 66-9]